MKVSIDSEMGDFAKSLGKGIKILDVGCGNKPYLKLFAHCEYTGIDVEQSGREMQDKEADLFYDGENIPFPDAHFQAVICSEVFEHCLNPDKLIREINRVLEPAGKFFFTVPLLWGEHEIPYDFRRFTSFGCKKLLEENGFRVQKQVRASEGLDAVRTLIHSDINYCLVTNRVNPGIPRLAARIMDKVAWALFDFSARIWRRRFPFPRLYNDNILHASKL